MSARQPTYRGRRVSWRDIGMRYGEKLPLSAYRIGTWRSLSADAFGVGPHVNELACAPAAAWCRAVSTRVDEPWVLVPCSIAMQPCLRRAGAVRRRSFV